jgi:hypothetical protein
MFVCNQSNKDVKNETLIKLLWFRAFVFLQSIKLNTNMNIMNTRFTNNFLKQKPRISYGFVKHYMEVFRL